MTAPVTLCGAQTPAVGSTRPPSTWFGAGVPCKVLVDFFGGRGGRAAHFVFLKYEFSKCFANLLTASLFHYERFSLPESQGCWAQKDGWEDRTDLAWATDKEGL